MRFWPWAVGTQGVNIASDDEAVLHWNGKRWFDMSRQPDVFALNDVLALSPKDAWAVGVPRTEGNERPASLPVIEHWNGKRWSLLQLDFGWTGVASLSSLASFAADTVWAGGGIRVSPAGATNPVLLQWNGTSWQNETPPRVTTPINGLAASADGTLWAVGRSFIAHTNCR